MLKPSLVSTSLPQPGMGVRTLASRVAAAASFCLSLTWSLAALASSLRSLAACFSACSRAWAGGAAIAAAKARLRSRAFSAGAGPGEGCGAALGLLDTAVASQYFLTRTDVT
jgi:hypothetical protein